MSTLSKSNRSQVGTETMDDEDSRLEALGQAFQQDLQTTETKLPVTLPASPSVSPPGVASTALTNRFRKASKGKGLVSSVSEGLQSSSIPEEAVQHSQQVNPVGTNKQTTTTTYNKPKYRIEGANIGSVAREPEWTIEQLQEIAKLSSTRINTLIMTETRRSTPDKEHKYVMVTPTGSISAMQPSWLGNIPWNKFSIGMGRPKPDEKTGKGKCYSDIVMKGSDWVLNQWTMRDVVVEGVPENILEKPPRISNGKPERRIGHDFVRIGIPKMRAAPVIETVKSAIPAVSSSLSSTAGYYWANASWGVTGNPAKFVYKDANGIMQETFKAYEAMKMIMGSSSMGVATIAISVGSNTTMQNGKLVPNAGEEEFSIKIHNMLHLAKVPYSSPPQSAANGFDVSDDIYSEAQGLSMPSGMNSMFGATASAFADQSLNPFASATLSVANNTIGGQGTSAAKLL